MRVRNACKTTRPLTMIFLMPFAVLANSGPEGSVFGLATSCMDANHVNTSKIHCTRTKFANLPRKRSQTTGKPEGDMFVMCRNFSSATRTARVELLTPCVISCLHKQSNASSNEPERLNNIWLTKKMKFRSKPKVTKLHSEITNLHPR